MLGNAPVEGNLFYPAAIGWCVVVSAALVGAVSDLRTGRIPNAFTLPLLAGGLLTSIFASGFSGIATAVESALLLALPCLVLFLFGGGGAGDVKLLGALGSWLTLHDAMLILVCVAMAGTLCGFITAMLRGRLGSLLVNLSGIVRSFGFALWSRNTRDAASFMPAENAMQPMPFGVAICLGVWVAAGGHWLWHF